MRIKKLPPSVILALLILLAFGIRCWSLGTKSFWLDEAYTLQVVMRDFVGLLQMIPEDVHPPLYPLLLWGWIKCFGSSEFAVRSLSVCFGVLNIVALYRLGKALFDRNTGLWASGLLAISVFHLKYSQEARSYALFGLLATISFYFFVRVVQKSRKRNMVGYVLSSCLLVNTHNFGVFIIIAQNALFAIEYRYSPQIRHQVVPWIMGQVVILAIYSPWFLVTLTHSAMIQDNFWMDTPSWREIPRKLSALAGSREMGLLMGTVICFGLARTKIKEIVLCFTWMFCLIFIPFIISMFWTPIFVTRYILPAIMPFYLLVGRGMTSLPNRAFQIIVVIALVLLVLPIQKKEHNQIHANWKSAAALVDQYAKAGDLVIFHAASCQLPFDLYSERRDLIKKAFPKPIYFTKILLSFESLKVNTGNIDDLNSIIENHSRVWLVLSYDVDRQHLIRNKLKRHFDLGLEETFKGVNLSLFSKPASALK